MGQTPDSQELEIAGNSECSFPANIMYIYIYNIPGTRMTPLLDGYIYITDLIYPHLFSSLRTVVWFIII